MRVALTLVLGPRRSGKSAAAERIAAGATGAGGSLTYLAPLTVTDAEMRGRVDAHRARRPADWVTVETAAVADALAAAPDAATVLLDSLGGWVSEVLWRAGALEDDGTDEAADAVEALALDVDRFAALAARRSGETVVVGEEAGWGPVPPHPGTRRWLDALGDATQTLSRGADRVLLVVAGRSVELR